MQHYADINESGNIVGFYIDEIHGDSIPVTAVPITAEEWQSFIQDAERYKLDGEAIREKTPEEIEEENANKPPIPKTEDQLRIEALGNESISTMVAVTEVFETDQIENAARERENVDVMLALVEINERLIQKEEIIASLTARVKALEGGEL